MEEASAMNGDSDASPPTRPPHNSYALSSTTSRALTPNRQLGDLLRKIDSRFALEASVEELLLEMASDFVQDVVQFSSHAAKHRRSTVLEAKDLQMALNKNYGISLVGANNRAQTNNRTQGGQARPARSSLHMHRMALKRKSLLRQKNKTRNAAAHSVSRETTAKTATAKKN